MTKSEEYQKELEKLTEIFKEVEPSKAKLVEGLIEEAAFLKSENLALRQIIDKTGGMIKVHPDKIDLQKSTEAAKQYLKNINSHSVIIKTLNGVLMKGEINNEDDGLSDYE